LKFKLDRAEKQAGKIESEENKAEVKRYKKEYNQKLLEVKKNLAERYPNNLSYRLELGQQYMILGDFGEAIKELQVARSDPRRKGFCLLLLGESFQRIKQKRLAMEHYESAVQEIPDRDADNKKKALYRAGTLALAMGEVKKAEKHLNVVASMDFSYRDVAALLDKIAEMGDDGQLAAEDGE
jgi:tetratricopeptide (TPR) repeat protein